MKIFTFVCFGFFLFNPTLSFAHEMMGMVTYNVNHLQPLSPIATQPSNAIGYTFLGRIDLGPGQVETGFQFAPISIFTHDQNTDVTYQGSYWMLPVLYRYTFLPPFFSLAVGADYAVVGTNSASVTSLVASTRSPGFQSHFGVQASLQAAQDVGEDLSVVLDIRYRTSLKNMISFNGSGARYQAWMVGLGIQKHLEF